ncbi:hypothetical protein CAPTEDRAFT_216629 [Capitella teleta]|uniref:Uncharacterized protein n=1 Tax=Capitella teleta TaxID=283909 RepID=R7TIW8_CAPTE|nr:hypothetical protein CAPTEDRAFT_216629 [Capitella teleta]|eukprot:ELT93422.1 hypothetical protein CAPTEDRAFT_216629 [Capitella teleta]
MDSAVRCCLVVGLVSAVLCQENTSIDSNSGALNTKYTHLCDLFPKHEDIPQKISDLRKSRRVNLIEYEVLLPEYEVNPLLFNMSRYYRATRWQRVFDRHGLKLSTLGFKFEALSLNLLTFGAEHLKLELYDAPIGCYGRLNETSKVRKVRDVLMVDLQPGEATTTDWAVDEDALCYDVVEEGNKGWAKFKRQCCSWDNDLVNCNYETDKHMKWVYYVITSFKILLILLGPLLVQKMFFGNSLTTAGYMLHLKEVLTKTLLVKKIRTGDGSLHSRSSHRKHVKEFHRFRQIVKNVPSDEVVAVNFKKLHVKVPHEDLIAENQCHIGLFRLLFDAIFRCGFTNHEPFASCCSESIFGTWSKRFLWFKLMDAFDCNRSCRKFCSWRHIFKLVGSLMAIVLVVLPYILRSAVFYAFEEDEMKRRKYVIEKLDLKPEYSHESCIFQWATPGHGLFIAMYITYAGASLMLLAFTYLDPNKVETIFMGAMDDLSKVSYVAMFRMLCAHILLPFEKFGLVCGALVAVIYWPFALPLCLITFVMYGIPAVYLFGRFLITSRLPCLRECPLPTPAKVKCDHQDDLISKGTNSFETCLLLNNISPNPMSPPQEKTVAVKSSSITCHFGQVCGGLKSIMIGLLLVSNMLILLMMYSEVIGFMVEVAMYSIMGAILNASSAAKYVIIVLWVAIYFASCFHGVHVTYLKLNKVLFHCITEAIKDDIKTEIQFSNKESRFLAFKYLNSTELEENRESVNIAKREADDVSAEKSGKLFWKIQSLVLFIDDREVARIPKELYMKISQLNIPGCPGPLHGVVLKAIRHFVYMLLFWAAMLVVVLAIREIQESSDTNQVIFIMILGLFPMLIRYSYQQTNPDPEFNTFSLHGKIHQLLSSFSQKWPIYDLEFDTLSNCESLPIRQRKGQPCKVKTSNDRRDGPNMMNPPDVVDPTHVDLLITVRDDEENVNLRAEASQDLGIRADETGVSGEPPPAPVPYPGQITHSSSNSAFLHNSKAPFANVPRNSSVETLESPANKRMDLVVDLGKTGVQVVDVCECTLMRVDCEVRSRILGMWIS